MNENNNEEITDKELKKIGYTPKDLNYAEDLACEDCNKISCDSSCKICGSCGEETECEYVDNPEFPCSDACCKCSDIDVTKRCSWCHHEAIASMV